MSEYRDLLEQERRAFAMRDGTIEGLERRRNRKRRNGQILAGVLALLIAAAGVGGGLYAFRTSAGPKPGGQGPTPTPSPAPVSVASAPSRPSGPIQFVDAMHGWAVIQGDIQATSDGGKAWTSQYSGPLEIEGVTFVDVDHGWAVSASGLLRTDDGGSQWILISEQVGFVQIQFEGDRIGWGTWVDPANLGPGKAVVHTKDGGETWTVQDLAADSVCSARDGNTANLWTVGRGPGGISLMRSTDGGDSWSESSIPVPEGESWSASLQCMGDEVWVQLKDGGAAGHTAYGVFRSVGGGPAQLVLQEAGTTPFGYQDGVYESEDPYPGPFTVAGIGNAYFLNWCPPCGGSLPSVSITLTSGGSVTDRFPVVTGDKHAEPLGVSFLPPQGDEEIAVRGWALLQGGGPGGSVPTILQTFDGGQTWTVCFGPGF